jgi:hypothetical protein
MPISLSLRVSLLSLAAAALPGQMHKVEKPERVTRAVGVYEWTGDLAKPSAARLIPVSLFIDGHFEDAGVYLARPVPFALQTGYEYSVEKAGQTEGTLDLDYARNVVTRRAAEDDNPVGAWYGYGKFSTPAVPKPRAPLKPSAQTASIVGSDSPDDDTPHFIRRADTTSPTGTPGSARPAGTGSSTPNSPPDDDPDRPTLRHRDPKDDAKRKRSRDSGGGVSEIGDLNVDPDRPTLRRGVPAAQQQAAQLTGLPPSLHQAVAVSDAATRDPHLFAREWDSSAEREQTLAALEALARPHILAYLQVNKLDAIPAAPASPASGPSFAGKPGTAARRAAARKAAAAPPPISLTQEDLRGYNLTYGGLPTFVYTVETPVKAGGPVYLTLVAQRLPSGQMQTALLSITDATHLDRVPWMRPVDVVDPDWSHRGDLLMELRAQNTRQFALYRLVTAQAEQAFTTGVID